MNPHQIVRSLLFVAGLSAALSSTTASAQSAWTGTVSGFGGGSVLPTFNANVADPALAAKLNVRDRKINDAVAVGGSVGVWHGLGGGGARLGIRGELSFQPSHADAQTNPASGTFFGQPFNGAVPIPKIDGSVTPFMGAVLFGWEHGRVMPYAGGGGGLVRTIARDPVNTDTDVSPSWTGIAGLAVRLGPRVSTDGEYRYTVVEPTIVMGTQTVVFKVKPSQFVAGFSVKL